MGDIEDTSSVRISSFQPRATQNYIDIVSFSLSLSLSLSLCSFHWQELLLYQDGARLTLLFNNVSDLKEYVLS